MIKKRKNPLVLETSNGNGLFFHKFFIIHSSGNNGVQIASPIRVNLKISREDRYHKQVQNGMETQYTSIWKCNDILIQ
jgi:hypothetical protein